MPFPSIGPRYRKFDRFGKGRFGPAGIKHPQRIDRPLAIMTRARQRIGNSPGLAQQAGGVGKVRIADAVAGNRRLPESAVRLASPRIGEDDRQRHLAVAEIVARILAHRRFVRFIVDRVIDQLECNAQVAAIDVERLFLSLAAIGDDSGNAAGSGEQRGGLGADNIEILFLARVDLALGGQLVDFSFGDHG